ncbi:MAG: 16S rRNA (cytidine(1402)-2'-O)-methyltransferase [Thiobacillaceae bacterium]|nr:16S rRNA (cytidine(1402)-2'-O)-methyltransferase [Thiobacillaceae bacterium]
MTGAERPVEPGTLYVVATPIGHLRDITLRALDVLAAVDLIAAEDTRITQGLLAAYGLRKPMQALHEHNEAQLSPRLIEALRQGHSIALVCDAGTPAVSDPGARLIRAVRAAGLAVTPVPGASAATAAMSVSGLAAEHWLFYGFLPSKAKARREALQSLSALPYALVFYEAPHRIAASVADMAELLGGQRSLVLARELTKRFEQVVHLTLSEAEAWLAADPDRRRGEFVLVVAGTSGTSAPAVDAQRVLAILRDELPPAQAARLAARLTGCRRQDLYALALAPADEQSRDADDQP